MWRLGLGYRRAMHDWIAAEPEAVDCLEVTAEHFFEGGASTLKNLAEKYHLYVHGLGLSLGTPGPLDSQVLKSFAQVARWAKAEWVSEHVAFTRAGGVDLGHLNPVPKNENSLQVLTEHAIEVREVCGKPLILENITSDLQVGGTMAETEFLNRLCDAANCGLLLDVTNLFINSKNHGYEALDWLRQVQPEYIRQLHIVGYSLVEGRYRDQHSAAIQEDLMDLFREVIDYSEVQAVILERDQRMDEIDEIEKELIRLRQILEQHRPRQRDCQIAE